MKEPSALPERKRSLAPLILLFVFLLIPTVYNAIRITISWIQSREVTNAASVYSRQLLLCGRSVLIIGAMLGVFLLLARLKVIDPSCLCKRDLFFIGFYEGFGCLRSLLSIIPLSIYARIMPLEDIHLLNAASQFLSVSKIIFALALFAFFRIRMTGRVRYRVLAAPTVLITVVCLVNLIFAPFVVGRYNPDYTQKMISWNRIHTLLMFLSSATSVGFMIFFARRGREYPRWGWLTALTLGWIVFYKLITLLPYAFCKSSGWFFAWSGIFILLRALALLAAHFILKPNPVVPYDEEDDRSIFPDAIPGAPLIPPVVIVPPIPPIVPPIPPIVPPVPGTAARRTCAGCGKALPANAKFCPACGTKA